MSSSQTMVVLIVLIVSVAGIFKARYRGRGMHIGGTGSLRDRRGMQELFAAPEEDTSKAELLKELETLRERVKVLERIATDANSHEQRQSRSIAAEIEALRDK